jgi:hypothetical protein
MPQSAAPNPQAEPTGLRPLRIMTIAACGGNARDPVKALIVANEFLEAELQASVSSGYVRGYKHGRFKTYTG